MMRRIMPEMRRGAGPTSTLPEPRPRMDVLPVQFAAVGFSHTPGSPIVDDVSLSCLAGETVAVVGRSGAGKSTLLRLVNRLLLPTSGQVSVQGRDTATWDPIRLRRSIGYVMQDAGLFPHMTVEENVSLVPRLEQWDVARIRARTRELLELVGLPPDTYAARRPAELSGGQRQRVGLARALAVDPPILLMDEPFGALDPITRKEVRREFARLKQHLRTTALMVTHDMVEAFALADRIGVMEAGRLIALDTPDALARSADPRVQALLDGADMPRERPS
ncbi:MAG TPA: ATP-binding cassette domain-containing protein [Vicinamibacterales bacterium]|nr:ATP-binding cassette domain-containing protein [Vicinamibacterales bacterium]